MWRKGIRCFYDLPAVVTALSDKPVRQSAVNVRFLIIAVAGIGTIVVIIGIGRILIVLMIVSVLLVSGIVLIVIVLIFQRNHLPLYSLICKCKNIHKKLRVVFLLKSRL